jgi:hypothetical protein
VSKDDHIYKAQTAYYNLSDIMLTANRETSREYKWERRSKSY